MTDLLLDSNILIDYLAQREPFYGAARKLMILGVLEEARLWISASQINDVFYVVTNGGQASKSTKCQDQLTACRKVINICSVNESDIDAALNAGWQDLEDACVSVCAQKINADFIITRDAKGFKDSPTQALDAQAYFDYLATSKGLTYEEIIL
jgi:predicted nucleic acid-binding protein